MIYIAIAIYFIIGFILATFLMEINKKDVCLSFFLIFMIFWPIFGLIFTWIFWIDNFKVIK